MIKLAVGDHIVRKTEINPTLHYCHVSIVAECGAIRVFDIWENKSRFIFADELVNYNVIHKADQR